MLRTANTVDQPRQRKFASRTKIKNANSVESLGISNVCRNLIANEMKEDQISTSGMARNKRPIKLH